jgi:predicted branched-subunit amino acid permease
MTDPTPAQGEGSEGVDSSRRRLVGDTLGISLSAAGFGLVYGVAARTAGFSILDVAAMSLLVFAGGAQFAAVGYVASGVPWPTIVVLTAFINARHVLYATVLRPYVAGRSKTLRSLMAHVLDDETFALSIAHFRRIGRFDLGGYWIAAIGGTFIPWIGAGIAGAAVAGAIPDPTRLGLDAIFPSAMAGLAVGLVKARPELVAAVAGAALGVAVALAWDPAAGIVAGGVGGPLVAMSLARFTRVTR